MRPKNKTKRKFFNRGRGGGDIPRQRHVAIVAGPCFLIKAAASLAWFEVCLIQMATADWGPDEAAKAGGRLMHLK